MYQNCFGGKLHFDYFEKPLQGYKEVPVVRGLLVSKNLNIIGSDLVHDEGRRIGNYISIFIRCNTAKERLTYLQKLDCHLHNCSPKKYVEQKLIEVKDCFDVSWIFEV